jgi:hypothetical protein
MYGLGQDLVVAGQGIPAGGIGTYEDWNAFVKAVQTSTYETDHAQLTGLGAIRLESLEGTLRAVVEREETFKLFRALKRQPVTSAVHEYAVQTSIGGQPAGAFNSELGSIASDVGEYERRIVFVKYLMTMAAISHVAAVQKGIVNLKAQENMNALLRLGRTANWASYHGDSEVAPMQFDGLEATLTRWRNGENVYDFQDQFSDLPDFANQDNRTNYVRALVDLLYSAYAKVMGVGNFGKLTHVHLDPFAQVSLDRYLDPAYRVVLNDNPTGLAVGAPVTGIRTSFGNVYTEQDVWIEGQGAMPHYARYGKVPDTAPGAPTVAATAQTGVAGSKWTPTKAGTYFYVVAAIDERGVESIPSAPVSATVAAGGAIQLTITPNADRKQTGYAIYRSKRNPGAAPDLKDFRLVKRIPANPDRAANTVFQDKDLDVPGSSKIFAIRREPEALQWVQLLPATQFPLYPTNQAVIPWAVLLYGSLMPALPNHHVLIKNFVPPEAPWKPY